MRLVIGVTTEPEKYKMNEIGDNDTAVYEFEEFVEGDFFTAIKPLLQKANTEYRDIPDEDAFCVLMDLHKKGQETKLGGCAISGRALKATRASIMEISAKQLSRQVQETLKEHNR